MRFLDFSQYVLYGCLAAALLAGCGESQPPIVAPGTQTAAAHVRHPVAHPDLAFLRHSRHPLKFTVRQTGYYGRFTMSDSTCGSIASVSPKSAKGPRATFRVEAN